MLSVVRIQNYIYICISPVNLSFKIHPYNFLNLYIYSTFFSPFIHNNSFRLERKHLLADINVASKKINLFQNKSCTIAIRGKSTGGRLNLKFHNLQNTSLDLNSPLWKNGATLIVSLSTFHTLTLFLWLFLQFTSAESCRHFWTASLLASGTNCDWIPPKTLLVASVARIIGFTTVGGICLKTPPTAPETPLCSCSSLATRTNWFAVSPKPWKRTNFNY